MKGTTVKTTISIITFALLSFASAPAWSAGEGNCHFHGSTPASEQVVVNCADKRRDALVASGKLAKSWQASKVEKAALVDGKKGKEWRVTYKDPAATDKTKETLYLIFTPPGNFVAANYTGE